MKQKRWMIAILKEAKAQENKPMPWHRGQRALKKNTKTSAPKAA